MSYRSKWPNKRRKHSKVFANGDEVEHYADRNNDRGSVLLTCNTSLEEEPREEHRSTTLHREKEREMEDWHERRRWEDDKWEHFPGRKCSSDLNKWSKGQISEETEDPLKPNWEYNNSSHDDNSCVWSSRLKQSNSLNEENQQGTHRERREKRELPIIPRREMKARTIVMKICSMKFQSNWSFSTSVSFEENILFLFLFLSLRTTRTSNESTAAFSPPRKRRRRRRTHLEYRKSDSYLSLSSQWRIVCEQRIQKSFPAPLTE